MSKTSLKTLMLLMPLCSALLADDPFLENEQRNRQRDIFENLNKNPTDNIETFQVPKAPIVSPLENEQCFDIHNITISGVTLLKESKLDSIFSNYLNKCASLSNLKNLTNEISALYIDKGYITSQAYLSPQNIAEGNLTIQVVEGKIKNITPDDINIKTASVSHTDNYLNVRDIEVLIENINRLPSNHATMKLNPSDETGYTDVVIENTPTRRFGGSLGIDNFGGKKTGRAQLNGRVNLDNLLSLNDQLNILFNTSNKYYTDENSVGNGYDYSLPFGRTTFTFSQRNNRFHQKVKTGASSFLSEGATKTYTLDAQYRVYHDQKNRLNAGISLSNYRTNNYFGGVHLDSSSYRLSKVTLAGDYLYQIPGFYTFVNLAYIRGADIFNTYHHTQLDDEYEIYNISLSAMKDIYPFRYSLSAYAQLTNDSLFGSDRISIGGPYSVRGFGKEGLSGNEGYYVRNEFAYNTNYDIFDGINNSFFIALDGGAIKSDDDSFGGKLMSYSFGTKLQSENLEASVHYAIPAYKKDVSETGKFFGISFRARF